MLFSWEIRNLFCVTNLCFHGASASVVALVCGVAQVPVEKVQQMCVGTTGYGCTVKPGFFKGGLPLVL